MRRDELRQNRGGTYIETINPLGYDILVNGSNRYLNFNAISGTSGYGFRDNAGTIEYKDSGGAWASISGSGGATISGTPVDNQVAIWASATSIEGNTNLQFDGTKLSIGGVDTMTVNGSLISTHLAVHGADGLTEAEIEMHRHGDTAGAGTSIYGARSRGTVGSPTVVQSGDALLNFTAVGYDGTDYATAAQIQFEVDGTPGSNDMPGRILFNTSADGGQTLTERMRISSAGVVSIPTATGNTLVVDTDTFVVDATNNRVGIGTTAPTHALTFPASSTGIALYNTADQTTNFERVTMGWSSNVYLIQYLPGGSGAARAMRLSVGNSAAADQRLTIQRNTGPFFEFGSSVNQAYNGIWVRRYNLTNTISSGTAIFNQVSPTIVNSGTAGYIMNLLNPTETSTGSGVNLFQDFQLASSSVFTWTTSGLMGIKTQAPTHSLTFSNSTTGIALYNTADQTTNFERALMSWSSNIFTIAVTRGGTGSTRRLALTATGGTFRITESSVTSTAGGIYVFAPVNIGTGASTGIGYSQTASNTSGNVDILSLTPTWSQTGTASYTVLFINSTETTTGSGAKNLILAQVGGVTKFGVSSTGLVTMTSSVVDVNNNELLSWTSVASAVNEITISNNATGSNPIISATGGDSDVGIDFQSKGAGVYNFKATASGPTDIRLYEDTDNGTNYGSIIAPSSMSANRVFTLPAATGTLATTSGAGAATESFIIAIGDETTAITTGTAKVTFRMPYAFTITAVRASLTTASSSGNPAFDINEGGVSILSTTLTIDANELTSTTAATPVVISDTSLADDASITIDIDTAGTGAKGAKIYIIGYKT